MQKLDFERLYVVGTPRSDNTTTANFHQFVDLLSDDPNGIAYLEFRADDYVEFQFCDGRVKRFRCGSWRFRNCRQIFSP